ncbi:glycosyltransferase family 2 protein [Desulfonauticus submarinus]|uniref:glycosyltransferase family 2 protein n=1 Tax=Desulfonauticus submarinus TaxID=206665 RepID=UPI000B835E3F|nr:glycosyltransferase [Desulfonauticus submarinus]
MLVSVIIPTYNRASFLKDAVLSVLEQTYTNLELIIVDDGSTDDTSSVVSRIKDKRLRYFYQENKGVAAARNFGLSLAKGDIISFLDSDDYWLPTKLEKQVNFLQQTNFCVVQCLEKWIRKGKLVNKKRKHFMPAGWFWEKALEMCLIGPSCVLLYKQVFDEIGLFDENFVACEDYELWLRLLLHYPVGIVPEELVVKRGGHFDQLSRSILGLDLYRIYALIKLKKRIVKDVALVEKMLQTKAKFYIQGCLKRGKLEEAERIIKLLNIK